MVLNGPTCSPSATVARASGFSGKAIGREENDTSCTLEFRVTSDNPVLSVTLEPHEQRDLGSEPADLYATLSGEFWRGFPPLCGFPRLQKLDPQGTCAEMERA